MLQWLHASYALGGVTGAAAAGAVARPSASITGWAWRRPASPCSPPPRWNRAERSPERAAEGACSAPVGVGAPAEPGALDPGAHGALLLPRGGIDGHLVRSLPSGGARRVAGAAGAAFVAFAGALFVGRLFAAKVLFGLGPRRTIIIAGIGGGIGGAIAVLSDTTVVVAAAFLLMGFAMSAAAPAGFSLVERSTDDPSTAIAAVATVGYTGFVWSPLLLGWIADTVDLRAAMAVIVLATVGITVTGLFARRNAPG